MNEIRLDEAPFRDVSRETVEKLRCYLDLLLQWSRTINLIGPSTVNDAVSRHIADSLQIFQLHPSPARWLDMGSGAGFPGMVTAICLSETGEGHVHLVESNAKKAAFLRAVARETGACCTVICERIERCSPQRQPATRLSARALADLDTLLGFSLPWFAAGETSAWFHKGRDYSSEVAQARRRWQFDLIEHPSTINPESMVLEIRGLCAL